MPGRVAGAYAVLKLHGDGETADDFVTVELGDAEPQFTAELARGFARAITAAADDLPRATTAHALDRFSVPEVVGVVATLDAAGAE